MANNQKSNISNTGLRPPIVVILGHVDHGKTSILDYIRKTKVAEKESGGITQHIGAYQAEHNGKVITFIDTPGHEAFSAMRSRGAKVADLAILVVAADEGVKPQTKEAISHIKQAELPMIVALNKMDRQEAQPEKVKSELAQEEIYLESIGGKIPAIEVSAKTGQGIDDLLDMILLISEVEELGKTTGPITTGVVIESYLDPRRGIAATLLVKEGTLKIRDIISADSTFGSVKAMFDFRSKAISEAKPSTPVLVMGLNDVPMVGEKWEVTDDLEVARQKVKNKALKEKERKDITEIIETSADQKILNLIIKADTLGTLEAIHESLQVIPRDRVILRILESSVGDVNESDLKTAESAKAAVFGFRIKLPANISFMAQRAAVSVATFQVIYDLIQAVRERAASLLEPEITRQDLGKAQVIAYFKHDGHQQIFGAKVLEGKIEKNSLIDVHRKKEKVGLGKLVQLQQNKIEIKEGLKGDECGILFEGNIKVEIGDNLEIYREEKKIRPL